MPTYNNALTQRPANMLAYQGSIGPVPRNEYLGALADFLAQSYAPERTQQMQGAAQFFSVPAISQTLDRLSYGEPLTTGAGGLGGTTRVRPEALEAAMAVAPTAKPVTMASLQAARAARQAALSGGRVVGQELGATLLGQRPKTMLGAITPQPMYAVPPSDVGIKNVGKGLVQDFPKKSSLLDMTRTPSEAEIKKMSREDLIDWLQNNDPNGQYMDPTPNPSISMYRTSKGYAVENADSGDVFEFKDFNEAQEEFNSMRFSNAEFPPMTLQEAQESAINYLREFAQPIQSGKVLPFKNLLSPY